MRKLPVLLAWLLCLAGSVPAASLSLQSPNQGGSLCLGSRCPITWSFTGLAPDTPLKLVLFRNGGRIGLIASGLAANAGSYDWTVGSFQDGTAPAGTGYVIRVRTMDDAVLDESDVPFSIAACMVRTDLPGKGFMPKLGRIVFTSPKAADVVIAGRALPVRWSAEGHVPEKCTRLSWVRYIASQPAPGQLLSAIDTPAGETGIVDRLCINGYDWLPPPQAAGEYIRLKIVTLDGKIAAESPMFKVYSSKPDLAFGPAGTLPSNLTTRDQDKLQVKVVVLNQQGGQAASSAQVVFMPQDNDKTRMLSRIFQVPALALDQRHEFLFSLPAAYTLLPGCYTITVDLDFNNAVDESDEQNNRRTQTVCFNGVANLTVCVRERLQAITTREAKLQAIVKNTGQAISPACVARWRIEGQGTKEFQIPNLAPGQEHLITRRETWWSGGTSDFTVEVDCGYRPELSKEDNLRRGTIHRHVWGTPVAPYDNSPQCPPGGG